MKKSSHWIARHIGVVVALLVFGLWTVIVAGSAGWGWNALGRPWNFENTGQLGDSFGVLSAAMASVAAYFAFQTYRSTREDVDRLERRAAEPSFLNLIERRYDVLDRVRRIELDEDGEPREWSGQEALDAGAAMMATHMLIHPNDVEGRLQEEENNFYGLSNLYRFTYHIVSFADRQFEKHDKQKPVTKDDVSYQYIRLLRAQFSNSELLMIAMNCAFSEGQEKFKPLVEKYALLHNLDRKSIDWLTERKLFKRTAFGLTAADRRDPKTSTKRSKRPAAVP